MGNQVVKLGIRVEKEVCEAGGTLKGRIYVNIRKDQQARSLQLVLNGEEISKIVRQQSSGENNRNRVVERGTNQLVQMDVPLATFANGIIPRGQYEYPFEWPIPDTLPTSMRAEDGESHCEISYKLTAYLSESSSTIFGHDYSTQHPLTIVGRSVHHELRQVLMDPEEYPIRTCCWTRGSIKLGWDAERSVVAPSTHLSIGVTGRNDSLEEVTFLRAKVVEAVEWKANGRERKTTRNIAESRIYAHELESWQKLAQLPSRRQRQDMNSYESLAGVQRLMTQLRIPEDVRDSFNGMLITVRHTLIVSAVTPNACCTTTPESSVLLKVQRRLPDASGDIEAAVPVSFAVSSSPPMAEAQVLPSDWSPMESEVVVIPAASVVPLSTCSTPTVARESYAMASAPMEEIGVARGPPVASARVVSSVSVSDAAPPVVPSAPSEDLSDGTSLTSLQASLMSAKDPVDALTRALSKGVSGLQNLSPHEFVETLKCCHSRQADVARQLAMTMTPNFYCRHVKACLWALPPHVRFDVLKEVVPLASDLHTNQASVEEELTPTELQFFRAALK